MQPLANANWTRDLFLTLLALGLLLTGFATWRYINTDRELQGNLAQVISSRSLNVAPETGTAERGLAVADVARREMLSLQYDTLMLGGSGLVILSLGWLGLNLRRYLQRRQEFSPGRKETSS